MQQLLRFVLSAIAICLSVTGALAQPPQYFNNNTGASYNAFPLNSTTSNQVQWIYPPNVFNSNGATGVPAPSGQITKVYFRLGTTANASSTYTNYTISLGQVAGTSTNFANATYLTGLTQCFYQASFQMTGASATQWYGIQLQNNFNYNPALALVFELKVSAGTGNQVAQVNGTGNQRIWGLYGNAAGSTGTGLVNFGFDLTNPCTQPTGAAVSGITMTTANFNWNAVTGSQGYEYAITTTSTVPSTPGTPIATTSYNATGLNNGTNYWFHVRNVCTTGSSFSNWSTVPFSTVACPAVPLANISVTGITTVAANINWTAVAGSGGYEYALTTSAVPPVSGTFQTTTSHSSSTLFPGTTYYFHVRSYCASPSISAWTTKSFTTLPCPPAGAPTITNNTPGTVSFSWPGTSTIGLTNYQYAVTSSATLPTTWQTTNLTSATVSGLTPGNTYYIHLRSNCTGSQAADQVLMFVNPFPPCYAPASITITDVNMHGANIKWNTSTTVPPAQGYQYAVNNNFNPPAAGTPTADTATTVTSLNPGTKYYVHVRTHCGTTNYSVWTKDSFTTPAVCVPTPVPAISNISSNGADVTWPDYPGIYGYEYLISNSPTAPSIAGAAIGFNAVSPTNLFTGTSYYFHLRVRCDTFNYSPYISTPFTTLSVCTPPAGLVMTAVTPTTATFSWLPVPGAQQYQYTVSTSSTPSPGNTYSSTNSVKVLSLTPGTPYYFHVRANCSASDTSGWESVAFNTAPVSVGSVSSNGHFDVVIYPNPARDVLHIEISGEMNGQGVVQLLDLSGRMLRQQELTGQEGTLDMSGLPQGMYLLKYRDSESSGVMRVQKL